MSKERNEDEHENAVYFGNNRVASDRHKIEMKY